jgi:hypothetical protein
VKNAGGRAAMRMKVSLNGDRRLTEKVILEVKAAARRLGLEIANVEVVRMPRATRKARKPKSRRKARARA